MLVSRRAIRMRVAAAMTALLSLSIAAAGQTAQQPAPAAPGDPAKTDSVKAATDDAGYRIGAGDVLAISVWNEPGASTPSATVRPDGKISMPIVKELEVLGLTPKELEKVLGTKLEQFIHGADVTVVVREIHSKKVYLVGAVSKVGAVALQSSMTVLQVLAEAGGPTDYAKRKKIYILRKENGKQTRLPFDYTAVIKGEHMEQNVVMMPDDTIVVPQ